MNSKKLVAGSRETHGTFTIIRQIRKVYLDNPNALIMCLHDGKSWRKDFYTEYKANREKTTKQVEDREAYFKQKDDITTALKLLGVPQCISSNMEADDLAEIYAKSWKGEKVTLISGDKDWLQLVDEKVTWVDPIYDRQCTHLNFQGFTGCANVAQFLETKYVLGDAGDNIKGVSNVGPKTLEKLYGIWNSVPDFFCDDDRETKWKDTYGKSLPAALNVSHHDVYDVLSRNESLMNLSTVSRPEPTNLRRIQEAIDAEAFKDLCYRNAFMSFLKDYDLFLKPFKENKFVIQKH